LNILFATLVDINSIEERGIYQDLMRELTCMGHSVFVVSPAERRHKKPTLFDSSGSGGLLKVRVGNIQKTGRIEKGLAMLLLEYQFVQAVRKYLHHVRFDLVVYSTPPITLVKLIKFIKKRDNATSYLLLKDIFPQNAVDLRLFSGSSLIYRFFRRKESALYAVSDHIGCMSQANVSYLLAHNRELEKDRVHVCPNSIMPREFGIRNSEFGIVLGRGAVREKYGLPADRRIFVYGGNLGRPQCVPFIVECLKLNQEKHDRYFVICGSGTDAGVLTAYINSNRPKNVKVFDMLPKDSYDELLSACDVGLIFLDSRFTIPNFPSRLLSYMEQGLPVLACTDMNTDVGEVIKAGGFGLWCESRDPVKFTQLADGICSMDFATQKEMGLNGRRYLEENYLASQAAEIILESVKCKV